MQQVHKTDQACGDLLNPKLTSDEKGERAHSPRASAPFGGKLRINMCTHRIGRGGEGRRGD